MLCSSSSYVASVLRTTVINSSFSAAQAASEGVRAQIAGLTGRGRIASRHNSIRKTQEKELRSR